MASKLYGVDATIIIFVFVLYLYCCTMLYNVIQCYTMLYNVIQCYTMLYNVVNSYTMLYNDIKFYTISYNFTCTLVPLLVKRILGTFLELISFNFTQYDT